jgi:hypothetical protein
VEICASELREDLQENYIESTVNYLLEKEVCHPLLVTPVIIYALKTGIDEFCEPLTYQLKTAE